MNINRAVSRPVYKRQAGMAELADVLDLGSSAERRAGSTPVTRTKHDKSEPYPDW